MAALIIAERSRARCWAAEADHPWTANILVCAGSNHAHPRGTTGAIRRRVSSSETAGAPCGVLQPAVVHGARIPAGPDTAP